MTKQKSKRMVTSFNSPGGKEFRTLGWGGLFLLYVCLFCILRTLFLVPAGSTQSSVSPAEYDHSWIERMLELENFGSSSEAGSDVPQEIDDMEKKVEFIVSAFALALPPILLRPEPNHYHSFLINPPFLALLTPPPKADPYPLRACFI